MAFIKFQKDRPKKGISTRTIGINSKGRFAFYKPVVKSIFKGKDYIELWYDPEANKIGILPLPEPSDNSFRLQGKTTKMVVAKKFFNRFKIQLKDQRYEFSLDENRMLIVQI